MIHPQFRPSQVAISLGGFIVWTAVVWTPPGEPVKGTHNPCSTSRRRWQAAGGTFREKERKMLSPEEIQVVKASADNIRFLIEGEWTAPLGYKGKL